MVVVVLLVLPTILIYGVQQRVCRKLLSTRTKVSELSSKTAVLWPVVGAYFRRGCFSHSASMVCEKDSCRRFPSEDVESEGSLTMYVLVQHASASGDAGFPERSGISGFPALPGI